MDTKDKKLKERGVIMKKICVLVLVTISILITNTGKTYAYSMYEAYGAKFDKAWENTIVFYRDESKTKLVGKFIYGYDTFLINEDYCWTENYRNEHQAGVSNDKGVYYGFKRSTYAVSKKEITHKGREVIYYYWVNSNDKYYEKFKTGTNEK